MGKLTRELRMGIHNRFDIEVVDVKTGKVKQRAQAFNVICNSYFSTIISAGDDDRHYASDIVYGSGTGTPAATDTDLFTRVGTASATASDGASDGYDMSQEPQGIWRRVLKRVITNNMSVGTTIREVGLWRNTLLTHAMLQDMNGNPISIQHTGTDIINIYCNLYLHYDGQAGDIILYGVTTNGYYFGVGSFVYTALLGKSDTGSDDGVGSSYYKALTRFCFTGTGRDEDYGGQYQVSVASRSTSGRSFTIKSSQVPITGANTHGIAYISGFSYRYNRPYQIPAVCVIKGGGTAFPPSRITDEAVGVGNGSTTKFRTAFHAPYNATVKVNGVAVSSGVQVKKLPAVANSQIEYNGIRGEGTYLFNMVYKNALNIIRYTTNSANELVNSAAIESIFPEIGLSALYIYVSSSNQRARWSGSDDGVNWTSFETDYNLLPENAKHYKYYKYDDTRYTNLSGVKIQSGSYDGYNIIFDTPPAQGDVITIDYTTDYIPKDSDHVLDVELTLSFGEWNPTP